MVEDAWAAIEPIVGESHYQPALRALAHRVGRDFTATLQPQPENPHDSNAVAVLGPQGETLGYLPRSVAAWAHEPLNVRSSSGDSCECAARLTGGEPGKPNFGVVLSGADFGALFPDLPYRPKAPVKQTPATKTCPYCAETILAAAIVCKHCHRDLRGPLSPPTSTTPSPPSPGVAAVLSLVIPGAGQMYRGQVGVGLVWLFAVAIGYLAYILPGLILHLVCIVHAASSRTSARPRAAPRLLTEAERLEAEGVQRVQRKRTWQWLFGFAAAYGLLWLGIFLYERTLAPARTVQLTSTPTALRPVRGKIRTARGVLTVPGQAALDGSSANGSIETPSINVWTDTLRIRASCRIHHGTTVEVKTAHFHVGEERYYFEVTADSCSGWVPESFVRPIE